MSRSGRFMARIIRVGLLIFVLLAVAQGAWIARARTADWKEPLRVVIYPINGDHSTAADRYIQSLQRDGFEPLVVFMREQARIYGLSLRAPVEMYLAPRVEALPPAPPQQGSRLEIVFWSLQLRFWAWRHDAYSGPKAHVRMFVKYFAPLPDVSLQHSVGLRQG